LNVITLSEKNWDKVVSPGRIPVLVDFWAEWCQYSRMLKPVFENVSDAYAGRLAFGAVDVEDQTRLAERFGIVTIPTLKAFSDRRTITERAGYLGEGDLRQLADDVLGMRPSAVEHSSILVDPRLSPPGRELELITRTKTIAIVGLSKDPAKDSYTVAAYMKRKGYRVIPVNPAATEVLGEKAYPSLIDIPDELAGTVDIVDIFRPSEAVPPIVDQAVQLKKRYGSNPKAVWMQLGIENATGADVARRAGMEVVQNMCIGVEHRRSVRLGREKGG
jgi:predicted CoA-binding protein